MTGRRKPNARKRERKSRRKGSLDTEEAAWEDQGLHLFQQDHSSLPLSIHR